MPLTISKWFAVLFLLFSCSHREKIWTLESIGQEPYSRLSFSSPLFPHITLEFLPLDKELASFVTVSEMQISSSTANIPIALCIDGQYYETNAHLYQGGQRLSLDKETTHLLSTSLYNGKSVELTINRYKILLPSDQFSYNYSKLLHKEKPWEISLLFYPP